MTGRRLVALLATAIVACAVPLAASAQRTQAQASPKEWTTVMCTSLTQWQKTVMHSMSSLQTTLAKLKQTRSTNLRSVRTQFASFLDDVARSTDTVRSQLHDVGAPSIAHGSEIEKQLEGGFASLAANFRGIAGRARKMSVNNPKSFLREATSLESAITNATGGLGNALSALQKYDSSKIDKAAKSIPACKTIS